MLSDVRGEFYEGGGYVIKGRSGAGKTTFLHVLGALQIPSKGKVMFHSKDLYAMSSNERTRIRRDNMGFVFQQYLLNPRLTSVENIMLPMLAREKNYSYCTKTAMALLEEVGLEKKANNFPYPLSGGEQQRVAVARSFANDPQWIFADEPTGA